MTPVKWNILAGFLADLKFTEKHCKTRTIGKERCAEIADALDAAFEKMKSECDPPRYDSDFCDPFG
jgi:monomeric isocitrate dehydrogenase